MRHILVTGANKGIGLAIARAILDEHDDTFVHLGARDRVVEVSSTGVVDSAAIGTGAGATLREVLDVNTLAVARVCETFLP